MLDIRRPAPPSTPFEDASAETSMDFRPVDVEALPRALDPDTCPERLLKDLASDYGVKFWRDYWPAWKKRLVIKLQPWLDKNAGEEPAIRAYLDLAETPVLKVIRPGQRILLGGDVSDEARARWLQRLPQLRIYRNQTYPRHPRHSFFDLNKGRPDLLLGVDTAPVHQGRMAVLWDKGTETDLAPVNIEVTETETTRTETYRVPLMSGKGYFCLGRSYLDGPDRIMPDKVAAEVATIEVTRKDVSQTAKPVVQPVPLGLKPVNLKPETGSEPTPRVPHHTFLGHGSKSRYLLGHDAATNRIFERFYLRHPDRPQPVSSSGMHVEGQLTALPHPYSIYVIDTRKPASKRAFVPGKNHAGFLDQGQDRLLKDAVEAARIAQGGSDILVLRTKIFRPLQMTDSIDLSAPVRIDHLKERY